MSNYPTMCGICSLNFEAGNERSQYLQGSAEVGNLVDK